MRHGPAPMILAETSLWLNISINLLLVLQVVVSLLLIGIVMMQRPKQEGLGAAFAGGMTDQMFGARTTSVLQKGTVYLGITFFALALALAILISHRTQPPPTTDPGAPIPVGAANATQTPDGAADTSLSEEYEKIAEAARLEAEQRAAAAEETPAVEAPAEEAPAVEAPAEEAPAEEVPAEEVPAVEAPAEEAPVEEAPVESPGE